MRLTTSLLAFTVLSALAGRAYASGEIDIFQFVSDVVAAGSGAFDITDLTFNSGAGAGLAGVAPSRASLGIGAPEQSAFYASLSGPLSIGSGRFPTAASSASGDRFGIGFIDELNLIVPFDYVSGAPLLGPPRSTIRRSLRSASIPEPTSTLGAVEMTPIA
jgi:hypothetical protein